MRLSGWGNYPVSDVRVGTPRYLDEVSSWLEGAGSLIPRGNGRSYGDAALNPELTLSMLALSRVRAFDRARGRIAVEAGVLLSDLLPLLVDSGWFPPVTPGTKFVSIGGMAAADVHGKNHHGVGSFAHHVESLEIMSADGEVRNCSPRDNTQLFEATLGGMGLTGLILTVTFRLIPIQTAWMRQETVPCNDLDAVMTAFEDSSPWTYSVAWIDCLARGRDLGRSLLYRAEHAQPQELPAKWRADPFTFPTRPQFSVPFFLPGSLLNGGTVRGFNRLYYRRNAARAGEKLVDIDSYFYPLDSIREWNRMYGRAGFVQHQSVLPLGESADGLRALLEHVGEAGSGSFLAVLKRLGPGRSGLSFPMEGYTLALDFPVTAQNLRLLSGLDAIVEKHGGRIYLAKDARAGRSVVTTGYGDMKTFTTQRREGTGEPHFESLLSRRLGL